MTDVGNSLTKAAAFLLAALALNLAVAADPDQSTTVSPSTYQLLKRVDQLIDKSAFTDALDQLRAILPDVDEHSLDQAVILRSIASVHSRQGNYDEAAHALEKSLATRALPGNQAAEANWNLGELYAASEQFEKAAGVLESSLKQFDPPTSQQHFLLANVYARLKQYEKSALYLRKAIALNSTFDDQWYKMLMSLYYEVGNYQEAAKISKQLLERFPTNKEYWLQLIGLYQQMNRYDQALAVNELMYRAGLVETADEILNLADLMSHQNAPYRAAELLEKEIKSGHLTGSSANWEKVANAWSQAREFDRAIAALKKASASNPSGELNFRLGQIYVELEKWKEAQAELSAAIRKGGLKDPGTAHLLFGISSYELHFHQKAREAFIKAQHHAGTRDTGKQWMDYIDSKG
jgi:tetratricopeptide (TPR) repeat protein